MAKRKKFTLKSGNNSSFKMMGASSPVEQDETTSDLDDFFSSANISAELEAMKNKRNEEAVPSTETTTTTDTEAFDIKNTEAYKKIKADAEARNQAAFDAETISNPSGSQRKTAQDLIDAQNLFDDLKKGVKPGGN